MAEKSHDTTTMGPNEAPRSGVDEEVPPPPTPHRRRPRGKGKALSLKRFSTGPLSEASPELQREALITTKEVATLLDISPLTVGRWRTDGSDDEDPLLYVRLKSNAVRYRLGDVLDWLERRKVRHTAEERLIRDSLQGGVGW